MPTLVPLHKARLPEVKAARDHLARGGVRTEILRPPGCKTSS